MKSKKELDFIKFVRSECKKYNVNCSLRRLKSVNLDGDTLKCSGWFDESVPELVVAMNRQDWIEILAHEYSHLTQWVDKIPLWEKSEKSLSCVWGWLQGENVKNIKKHLSVVRDLELDNEKRTVNLIKKMNLDVDIDNYIKKANSYIQFYNYLNISRRWCVPNNSPYKNKRLIEAMPKKFSMNYNELPLRIKKIFIEENI